MTFISIFCFPFFGLPFFVPPLARVILFLIMIESFTNTFLYQVTRNNLLEFNHFGLCKHINEANKGKTNKGGTEDQDKGHRVYADRMFTFSKHKAEILKNMNELITMCDAEAVLLVFSEGEKSYTFVHPYMEELTERLNNYSRQEPSEKNDTVQLVKAYKKQRVENLVKIFEVLEEELATINEKLKLLKKSRN